MLYFKPKNYPRHRLMDMSQELVWVDNARRVELSIEFNDPAFITVIAIPEGMQAVYSVYDLGVGVRDLSAYPHPKYRWVSATCIELEEPYTGVLQILRRTDVGTTLPRGLNPAYEQALHITQEIIGAIRTLGKPLVFTPPAPPVEPPQPRPPIDDLGIPIPLLGVRLSSQSKNITYIQDDMYVTINLPKLPTTGYGLHPEDKVVLVDGSLGTIGGDVSGTIELIHDGQWQYVTEGDAGLSGWVYTNIETLQREFLPRKYLYKIDGGLNSRFAVMSIGLYSETHNREAMHKHEDLQNLDSLSEDVLHVVQYTDFDTFRNVIKTYRGFKDGSVVLVCKQSDSWNDTTVWLLYYMDGRDYPYAILDVEPCGLHYRMVNQSRLIKDTLNLRAPISSVADVYLLHEYVFVNQGYIWDYQTAQPTHHPQGGLGVYHLSMFDDYLRYNKVAMNCTGFGTNNITSSNELYICSELPVYHEAAKVRHEYREWEDDSGMNYEASYAVLDGGLSITDYSSTNTYTYEVSQVPNWKTHIGLIFGYTAQDRVTGIEKERYTPPALVSISENFPYTGLSISPLRIDSSYDAVYVYGDTDVQHHNIHKRPRPQYPTSGTKVDVPKLDAEVKALPHVLRCVQRRRG